MSVSNALAPGTLITKGPLALPQTATANLFTVTGVAFFTLLVGVVTTVIGATAMTFEIGAASGSASLFGSSAAVPSLPVGSIIYVNNNSGTLLVGNAVPVTVSNFTLQGALVGGTSITWTTTANNTGAIQWYALWQPVSTGATVS